MPAVPPQGGHGDHAQQYYGDAAHGEHKEEKKDKEGKEGKEGKDKDKDKEKNKKGPSGMAMAAGGLAVGAVGGVALASALGTSLFFSTSSLPISQIK